MDMDDDMTSIGDILANMSMPGPYGEWLKKSRECEAAMGRDAFEAHVEELKRRGLAELDREHEKKRSRLRIEKSGLADSLDRYRFDNFYAKEGWQSAMFDMCGRFISEHGENGWLYLGGQPGCGKTHLGTAVCVHYLNQGKPTRYVTHRQLLIKLRSHANDDEGYQEVLDEYGKVQVLYIDDFMKFNPSESDVKNTFDLINMRYQRSGITIITSERSLDEIVRVDDSGALGSRIKERCGEFSLYIAHDAERNYRMRSDE
jgi:DNA replication protein DnaC